MLVSTGVSPLVTGPPCPLTQIFESRTAYDMGSDLRKKSVAWDQSVLKPLNRFASPTHNRSTTVNSRDGEKPAGKAGFFYVCFRLIERRLFTSRLAYSLTAFLSLPRLRCASGVDYRPGPFRAADCTAAAGEVPSVGFFGWASPGESPPPGWRIP